MFKKLLAVTATAIMGAAMSLAVAIPATAEEPAADVVIIEAAPGEVAPGEGDPAEEGAPVEAETPADVEAEITADVAKVAPVEVAKVETITFAWELPDTFEHEAGVNPNTLPWSHDFFPQTLLATDGTVGAAQCGEWVQMDTYRNTADADRARVQALIDGGILAIVNGNPADAGLHMVNAYGSGGWWFEWTGDCATIPEKPTPEAVVETWEGDVVCGDTEVTIYTKTTNVGHRYDEDTNAWILDPQPSDRSITVESTRPATEDDLDGLDCATPVEPEEPATPEAPVAPVTPIVDTAGTTPTASAATLANTGTDTSATIMAIVALLGGAIVLIRRRFATK